MNSQEDPKINIQALLQKVRHAEIELFAMKLQYKKLSPRISGKIIIDPPSSYSCSTCNNTVCLYHPQWKNPKEYITHIHQFTHINGCLEWLPRG